MKRLRSLTTCLLCTCVYMVFLPVCRVDAQVESAEAFVERMIRDYFHAIEVESLSFIEANYQFANQEAKDKLMSQFKFVFDMADTKMEQVDISKVQLYDEPATGLAFVHAKGVLTQAQTKEVQVKEHDYVVILACEKDRWKIAKVMRRGDYDNAVRIAAEAGTAASTGNGAGDEEPPNVVGGGGMSKSMYLKPVADNYVYAYSYSNWNNTNWGAHGAIGAGWHPTGGEKRSYLKFDLPSVDKVDKATLRLYYYHMAGNNKLELGIHKVTGGWQEGLGPYPPTATAKTRPGDLTWNNQPTFAANPAVRFKPTGKINKWIEIDVTYLVNEWLGGEANHGLVIKAEGGLARSTPECVYGFRSREHKDQSLWPVLVLSNSDSGQVKDDAPEKDSPDTAQWQTVQKGPLTSISPKAEQWSTSGGGFKIMSGEEHFDKHWVRFTRGEKDPFYLHSEDKKLPPSHSHAEVMKAVKIKQGKIMVRGPGSLAMFARQKGGAWVRLYDTTTGIRFNPQTGGHQIMYRTSTDWTGVWRGNTNELYANRPMGGWVPADRIVTLEVIAEQSWYDNPGGRGFGAPAEIEYELWFFPREGGAVKVEPYSASPK